MPETSINNEIVILTEELNKSDDEKTTSKTTIAENESNNQESLEAAILEKKANYDLKKFSFERILNNNTRNKSIVLLGSFSDLSDSDKAIVIFEKKAFQESDVDVNAGQQQEKRDAEVENGNQEHMEELEPTVKKPTYFCDDLQVQTEFVNNIYGSYQCVPPANLSSVKATVVYPATDKHIEKYSICKKYVISEPPEMYKEITLPYIISNQFSLEWVYNILEHKQEADRIIFEDPNPEIGFVLLPDLKWDGRNIENLYILVITHKRDIRSLRDLNNSHLPLLRNIRTRAAEAIELHYGILSSQLRMYFHYQPSFYHLHVHINPLGNDAPGIWCEKSHMLDTVINNLELLSDYYQRATLPFVLYDGNTLLELYEAKMTIRKVIKRSAEDDNIFDNEDKVKAEKKLEAYDEIKAVTK